MRVSISVDPWSWILGAFGLLLVPLRWLLAAGLAALIHECFHVFAIYLCGNRVLSIRIGIGGTVMETDVSGNLEELLCAMAGPVGSFLLLPCCHIFPELSLCAGIQGCFNLLPLYPLDGGRALRCLVRLLCPKQAAHIEEITSRILFLLLAGLCLWGALRLSLGLFPLLFLIILLKKRSFEKSLANSLKSGYNSATNF